MSPEERARKEIDRRLDACGWRVQDFADYLLYADGRAIGVVEAKPEGFTLKGVETQSAKYLEGLPNLVPTHRLPLPMSYESTGTVTQFTNDLEPDARSREVFAFHRPEELLRLISLQKRVRERLREMPPLTEEGPCEAYARSSFAAP